MNPLHLRLLFVVFFVVATAACFAENNDLPDPEKQPEFYANKWLVISATSTDRNACTCRKGVILFTSNYGGLKEGLFVCISACVSSKDSALSESLKLKKQGVENYIKHTGNLITKENTNNQTNKFNSISDSLFNTFIYYSRAKVLKKTSQSKQTISGDYFGLDKSIQISTSDSIIDSESDSLNKGTFECGFFCPPQYRNSIKDKKNLYCAVPVDNNRLLLVYFEKNWNVPNYNDSVYFVIQCQNEVNCSTYTAFVQEFTGDIPGLIRMHSLGEGFLLLEQITYRFNCPGEVIQYTVFDKNFKHIETIDELTTFPQEYLKGSRPIKKESIPNDEIASLNWRRCYIIESFYTKNYKGKQALLRYNDFSLSGVYLWNGNMFISERE